MTNDTPDHTPQPLFKTDEAIRAMENLMAAHDQSDSNIASRVYDPCCGSGSFLLTAAQHLLSTAAPGDCTGDYLLTNPPFGNT